jgi:outer membrane receptor protein involved in Fe transport
VPDALPPPPPAAAIIVTGKALPEPKADRVFAVQTVDQRQIEQSPSRQLEQILKDVPGVQLFRRSDARSGHPTSQGITIRALGGNASSRALLILDGVPQTDPFGGWINWPAYNPLDLAGIRLIRGGGSVANGPGALAGTIDMTSRADAGVSGEVDAGSRDSLEAQGRGAWVAGSSVMTVSGQAGRSDGFIPITKSTRGPADEPAKYGEWNGRGRWIAPIGSETEVQANLSAFHDWRTRGLDFTTNWTDGTDASVRLVGRGQWQWSALAYWQARHLQSSFANVSPGRVTATRVSLQDNVPSNGVGWSAEVRPPMPDGIELRIGTDARGTSGESRELYSFVAGEPTRRRRAGGDTWTEGLFTEATAEVGRATLTGGARIDHWRISDGHLLERTLATGAILTDANYPERSGWRPTARGGVEAPISSGFSLRSAAYLGWRMPTLNELFRPFRAGLDATAANPNVDPERLVGAEAGGDFRCGQFHLAATGFVNRLKDAIANVTLGKGPGVFPGVGFVAAGGTYIQRQNVDAVKVYGLEATAEWTSGPWSLQAGTSLTHARMEGGGAADFLNGLRPAQTPNFAATLIASWQKGSKGAEIILRRVGAQYDDDLNSDTLKAATTLDASLSWPLTRGLQIVARGENITNALVMAGINGDNSIERATPRTLWIGLRLR